MGPPGVLVERTMPPHASSVGDARSLVREALLAAEIERWLDDAQLAVSELVTNALVHAGTDVHLAVRVDGDGLRVEVGDGSTHVPGLRDYSLASGTGRGLHMVGESVSEWGTYAHGTGKVVWFEIRDEQEDVGQRTAHWHEDANHGDAEAIEIVLLNFPLLIHLAWQEHAAALLREYLLVNLDEDEVASFERHAHASAALNLLHEQVPAPGLLDDPEEIMTSATEPGVSAARLVLTVPPASVGDFETLQAMLSDATQYAETGKLLVPPTQPEVVEMRRWICSEVQNQALGQGPPQPWTTKEPTGVSDYVIGPGWDLDEFSSSDRAFLVTDEASVIVAASPPAVAFLGYRGSDELLGHRITRIVPSRYHQAHIAGTTLHMTNGRSALLGRRVIVPVVRADGDEALVPLVVEPRPLPHGRRVFVAELIVADTSAPAS